MCMQLYKCTHILTSIHRHTNRPVHRYPLQMHIYAYIDAFRPVNTYIYTSMHIHTHTHMCVRVYVYIYTPGFVYLYIYA